MKIEITKTLDASYRKIAYREMLWFIFSFVSFCSALIIFSRIINSPFGIMSLVGYEFGLLGLYGFYKFVKLAEKRIKTKSERTSDILREEGLK